MRRAPGAGIDLAVYLRAIPLLVRTPSLIVIPLMVALIGILLGQVLAPFGTGTSGQLTLGLAGFVNRILQLFGLGAACVIADDAWRHGRASFEHGWGEARRRAPELLMAAVGFTFVLSIGSYVGLVFGTIAALAISLLAVVLLIWTMPAAAVGGLPGAAALSASVERVRANAWPAIVAAVVGIALIAYAVPLATVYVVVFAAPVLGAFIDIASKLIEAVLQAIAVAYLALILTKTYADAAFGRRW